MIRLRNRHVVVLLTIALALVLAVSPALAVACPDGPHGGHHGKPKPPQTVGLQLLAINDFHGQLPYYSSTLGGAAVLSSYLDRREAEAAKTGAKTLRLGVGDLIGASPAVSGLLQDEPTMKVLDMLDFDYSTVGNHEFDEGIDELYRLQYGGYHPATGKWRGTKMRYLAANVVFEDTGRTIFQPYVVKQIEGIKVGFIGIGYENTPTIVTAFGTEGLTFLPEAATVNKYVKKLKRQGVQAIIVLMHDGGAGTTSGGAITGSIVPIIEAMDDEVDVVLTAHSHARYWGTIDGKLVTQAHSAGRAFADIDLVLDRRSGEVISKKAEIVATLRPVDWLVENLKVSKYVARTLDYLAPVLNEVIATAAVPITRASSDASESALGNLIADAQAWKMGTPIALMNPGGIRADLDAGEVTWGELYAVQPFSNDLVSMDLKGSDIELALEQQWLDGNAGANAKVLQIHGISYKWNPAPAAAGNRVNPADILVGGVAIDLAATYRVTMNNFLADGGDNFIALRAGTNRIVGPNDLSALVDYVKQLPQPINATIEGRIQLLP